MSRVARCELGQDEADFESALFLSASGSIAPANNNDNNEMIKKTRQGRLK